MGKRLLDVVVSFTALAFLWPLMLVIAVVVKLDGGPVLFRQERVGLHGVRFRIVKFRTMVQDASEIGPALTVAGDKRITGVGRLLRKSKMDELPQLWNVLMGDMALVGPRPEVPEYVDHYTEIEVPLLELKPGITDPASIEYRNENELLRQVGDPERYYRDVLMPRKAGINLEYARNSSWWTDIRVIAQTFAALVRCDG